MTIAVLAAILVAFLAAARSMKEEFVTGYDALLFASQTENPFMVAIDELRRRLDGMVSTIRSIPDRLYDASASMTDSMASKLDAVAEALEAKSSNGSSATADDPITVLDTHKPVLEGLRMSHPGVYCALLKLVTLLRPDMWQQYRRVPSMRQEHGMCLCTYAAAVIDPAAWERGTCDSPHNRALC